jgi:hypothetical protein
MPAAMGIASPAARIFSVYFSQNPKRKAGQKCPAFSDIKQNKKRGFNRDKLLASACAAKNPLFAAKAICGRGQKRRRSIFCERRNHVHSANISYI